MRVPFVSFWYVGVPTVLLIDCLRTHMQPRRNGLWQDGKGARYEEVYVIGSAKRGGWHVGDPIKIERRPTRCYEGTPWAFVQVTCYSPRCWRILLRYWRFGEYAKFQHAFSDIDGRSDGAGCKGIGAPNVTFGSNRSVKKTKWERGGANESTRVVNSRRRDEISIDPPRGSEMPKWGTAVERRREKSER